MHRKKFSTYWKYILLNIGIAVAILLFLFIYIISAYTVQGRSMENSLRNQDRIIILKRKLLKGKINRFDIVLFYKPGSRRESLIKRVIGLPLEKIKIKDGHLSVDSKKFSNHRLLPPEYLFYKDFSIEPVTIPKNCYFVLGDNIHLSKDSRHFGFVPLENIYGKALLIYWPPARIGRIL